MYWRDLTKPQAAMLTKAMRDAVLPYRQSYRPAYRLMEEGLLTGDFLNGLRITMGGLQVLRDYRAARWANYGCMAYLNDLQEVEAVMASISKSALAHFAAAAR